MLSLCSLQSFYCSQVKESSPHFDQTVHQFLEFHLSPPEDLVEAILWQEPFLSEEKAIENWKQLLALNILYQLAHLSSASLAMKVHIFERHPWNQSSQYFRSLVALNHAFAKMPIPEVTPHLLESGAALIDLNAYSPWLALPYHPYHCEFGIFLCLLALIDKRQNLQETVLHMAHWQLNTLDKDAKPLVGLFVREKEGRTLSNLCISYLFFRSAALLSEETPFAAVADKIMKMISEHVENTKEKIASLWVLIENWLNQHKILSHAPLDLPEHIYDLSNALVGYRSNAQHVICTLHGGHTGLGTLRQEDIEIVSYGPQYLPLGECQGFGIEGNALSDHGIRRSIIEWRRHAFTLKGYVRVVDQPASSSVEMGKFRGIWLEVAQEFKKPNFYLKAAFLGLDGWDSVAFSFFVKASCCKIQSQVLYPCTLEGYNGEVQIIIFEGHTSHLKLCPLGFKGTMQVIPLAGGNNFWGADFLIAYLMTPDQRHYQWHISAFS